MAARTSQAAFALKTPYGTYLINTARGGLIDETALIGALRSGRLSGAALDTYAREPLPPSSPLLTMPQVLAVSHIAGASKDVADRAARRIGAEMGRFVRGELVTHCVNPEALSATAGISITTPEGH